MAFKRFWGWLALLANMLLLILPATSAAESWSVEQILKEISLRDRKVRDARADLVFRVLDEKGDEKRSTHRLYWKDTQGERGIRSKILLQTLSPANLKGEGFLIWQGEVMEDSQAWLYLPELRQVRRVQFSSHSHQHDHPGSESDLNFQEAAFGLRDGRELRVIGQEMIQGEPHLIVEGLFKGEEGHSGRRYWIAPTRWTTARIDYLDIDGAVIKTQWIEWEQIGPLWVWKRTEVRPADSTRRTVLELRNQKVNQGLDNRLFTDRTLRTGRLP